MSCLGVHFALTAAEVAQLRSFASDAERLAYVHSDIEEKYFNTFPDFKAESDKSWDAMHRLLSDGQLSFYDGPEPLRWTVIGGEPLYAADDYLLSLKTPAQVQTLAAALPQIGKAEFRARYDAMDADSYGFPKSDDDFNYTWEWFTGVVTLYQRAAAENRCVLFAADQ